MMKFLLQTWCGVGVGMLLWCAPAYATAPVTKKIPPKPKTAIILQDKINGFVFTSSQACRNAFKIKSVAPATPNFNRSYDIFLSGSRWWPRKVVWTNFTVMSQTAYNAIPERTQPDKPDIILKLGNGNLLTQFIPQDRPRDFRCTLQESVR